MTSFLIRLLLVMGLLLCIIILDKSDKIDYDDVKKVISEEFNPLKIVKMINGNSKYFTFFNIDNIDSVVVSSEYNIKEDIENGYRYYVNEFAGAVNEVTGVIISIKYDDKYTITVLDCNDVKRVYSNLITLNYHIYECVEAGEVIGSCDNYYDLVIINEN